MTDAPERPPRRRWRAVALVLVGAAGAAVTFLVAPAGGSDARSPEPTTVASTTTSTSTTSTTAPATTTSTSVVPPTTIAAPAPPTSEPVAPPPTTVAPVRPPLPPTGVPTTAAGRGEGDHPCGVFTVPDIRTVVADVVRFVAVDGRCRFVRASGSDAAVATIDAYPSDESAAAGLREARLALLVDRCRSAGAGDERYVCVPTSGPVGTVGFVRRARSVLRLDIVAPADAGRGAELLRIAAPRL